MLEMCKMLLLIPREFLSDLSDGALRGTRILQHHINDPFRAIREFTPRRYGQDLITFQISYIYFSMVLLLQSCNTRKVYKVSCLC